MKPESETAGDAATLDTCSSFISFEITALLPARAVVLDAEVFEVFLKLSAGTVVVVVMSLYW